MAETEIAQPSDARGQEKPLPWWVQAKFEVVCALLGLWLRCFGLNALYALGWVFGFFEWLINFRLRGRFCRRVREVIGPQVGSVRALGMSRRFVQRLRCDKLFYLVFDGLGEETIARQVRLVGNEPLDAALSRGKGVHVLASHHGPQHVAGLLLAQLGYRVLAVRDRNQGASRRFIQERFARTLPESRGFQFVFADDFPRMIYRAFREPTMVCAALDVSRVRGERQRSMRVRLFDKEYEFLCGTVHMAMRSGVPIFQIFVSSLPFFRYRIEFAGPLWQPTAPHSDDGSAVAEVMQRYARGIEDFVRRYPCHMSKF